MSYRKSWSKTLSPDEMYNSPGLRKPSVKCPIHTLCFRSEWNWWEPFPLGNWRLLTPINIQEVMPGEKQKILSVETYSARWGSEGLFGWSKSLLAILSDGAKLWETPTSFTRGEGAFARSFYEQAVDISTYQTLDFNLKFDGMVGPPTLYLDIHDRLIKIDCEYYVDIPPETAQVEVTVLNRQTSAPIYRALVEILSGATVIASGYTGLDGKILFSNIDVGSYTLRVSASGFYEISQTIEVVVPKVSYRVNLVQVPSVIPLWAWVAGVIAVVGGIGYGVTRKVKEAKK